MLKAGRGQRQLARKRVHRSAHLRAGSGGRSGDFSSASAARFAVNWVTALALIFQTTLATVSMAADARQPNALGFSAICSSVDQQSPSDSHDRVVAGHLKCIACVVGHSLAPPPLSMALRPTLTFVGSSYPWSFSAPVPYAAPDYSRSARGPPATT